MTATRLAWVFIDAPPEVHEVSQAFWTRVLGEQPVGYGAEGELELFPTPLPVRVGLQRIGHGDAGRVHVDLSADDVWAEADRLEGMGATRVRDLQDHVILQDPAGVLFCVVPSRWASDAPLPPPEG